MREQEVIQVFCVKSQVFAIMMIKAAKAMRERKEKEEKR